MSLRFFKQNNFAETSKYKVEKTLVVVGFAMAKFNFKSNSSEIKRFGENCDVFQSNAKNMYRRWNQVQPCDSWLVNTLSVDLMAT